MMIIQFIDWLTTIFSGTNIDFTFDTAWITAIMDIVSSRTLEAETLILILIPIIHFL